MVSNPAQGLLMDKVTIWLYTESIPLGVLGLVNNPTNRDTLLRRAHVNLER